MTPTTASTSAAVPAGRTRRTTRIRRQGIGGAQPGYDGRTTGQAPTGDPTAASAQEGNTAMWMFSNGRKARHMTQGEMVTSAADNGGMGVTPDDARGHDRPAHRGFMGTVMHLFGRS